MTALSACVKMYQFSSVATQAVVEVGEGTQGTANPLAKGDVWICPSLQQLLHCLGLRNRPSHSWGQTVVLWREIRRFTPSFPVAMASERGEWPLQSRSVLALCESKRATTLLAFWKRRYCLWEERVSVSWLCGETLYRKWCTDAVVAFSHARHVQSSSASFFRAQIPCCVLEVLGLQ